MTTNPPVSGNHTDVARPAEGDRWEDPPSLGARFPGRSAVWDETRANPGRWMRTTLAKASAGSLRARYSPQHEIIVREGVVYVRFVGDKADG
jgi:hypothetical protein